MVPIPTTDLVADAIDFGDMTIWDRDDWPGMFAALRHDRPISWHTEPEIPGLSLGPGPGFWSLVRYDDIVTASRNPDVFISGQGTNIPDFPPEVYEFLGSMINMDPPRHTRFRLIVNRGFTPRQVGAIEQSVHADAVLRRNRKHIVRKLVKRRGQRFLHLRVHFVGKDRQRLPCAP